MLITRPIPNKHSFNDRALKFCGILGVICLLLWVSPLSAGEWANHQDNIVSIRSRISQVEDEIQKTAEVKSQTQNPEEIQALIKHILELHDELELEKRKLHEEIMHARFRHPEQGMNFDFQYTRTPASVPEAPQATSEFDERLDQVRHTMEAQYGVHRQERYRPRVTIQDHFLLQKKKDRENERIVLQK